MRFVVLRKADGFSEAGGLPSRELVDAMVSYNRELIDAGVLLDGHGLRPTAEGARVLFDGAKTAVVDGPFTESKELVAGYAVMQARTREEVVEWLRRWPAIDGDGGVRLEIRQVFEEGDGLGAVM